VSSDNKSQAGGTVQITEKNAKNAPGEPEAGNTKTLENRLLSLGALKIEVRSDAEVERVRQQGRALAKQMGCSAFDATLIATVVSELARIRLPATGKVCTFSPLACLCRAQWADQRLKPRPV
jgi:hypothetical protein